MYTLVDNSQIQCLQKHNNYIFSLYIGTNKNKIKYFIQDLGNFEYCFFDLIDELVLL